MTVRKGAVVLNVGDARRAAEFWTGGTGRAGARGTGLPRPTAGSGVRIHRDETDRTHRDLWVDRTTSDLGAAVDRLVALGGGRVEWTHPEDADVVVLAGTEGNPCCLIA